MHDTINGAMFKEMLLFGTVSIAQAQQAINDLNVFPVPDGDTGTNMSLTIQTAAQELKKIEPATVDQAASVTASALLDGLSDEAASREAEFITVFYGEDVNEEDAHKACDAFTRKCPDAEVNLICGGQPVYYYIISIE